MTQPPPTSPDPVPLNYETPRPTTMTRTRQAAWIALLVNGILGIVCGGWLRVSFGFVGYMGIGIGVLGGFAHGPKIGAFFLYVAIEMLTQIAMGITSIVCAVKVRRGARRATILALVMTWIQFLALSLVTILGMVALAARRSSDPISSLIDLLMFAVAACAQAIIVWLLIRTLRELSARPTLTGSPLP